MPLFEEHLRAGKKAGAVGALVALVLASRLDFPSGMALFTATVAGVAVVAGSVAPDLDSHDSVPRDIATTYVPAVALLGLLLYHEEFLGALQAVSTALGMPVTGREASVLVLGLAGAILFLGSDLVDGVLTTRHRETYHTVWFWLSISVISVPVLQVVLGGELGLPAYYSQTIPIIAATGLLGGVLVHLSKDGLLD